MCLLIAEHAESEELLCMRLLEVYYMTNYDILLFLNKYMMTASDA